MGSVAMKKKSLHFARETLGLSQHAIVRAKKKGLKRTVCQMTHCFREASNGDENRPEGEKKSRFENCKDTGNYPKNKRLTSWATEAENGWVRQVAT